MSDIGRWNGVDMLSELDFNISPLAYVANNPINSIDLFGMKREKRGENGGFYDPETNEVGVIAKRNEAYTGYFGNVFANQMAVSIDEARTGKRNAILQGFQDGSRDAAAIVSAPILAIGAAEIGVGAILQQGIAYVTRARMLSAGRTIIRQNWGSGLADFTTQYATKGEDLSKINYTSVLSQIFIKNPFASAAAGNVLEINNFQKAGFGSGNRLLDTINGNLDAKSGLGGLSKDIMNGTLGNIYGDNLSAGFGSNVLGNFTGNFMSNVLIEFVYKPVIEQNAGKTEKGTKK